MNLLIVEGTYPEHGQSAAVVSLVLDGRGTRHHVGPGAFRLTRPCRYPARSEIEIVLANSKGLEVNNIICLENALSLDLLP